MSNNFLVFAGIAPHPPIMVPEVGGAASSEVRGSIDAMRDFTQRIIDSRAESIVLISPHAPLQQNSFVAYMDTPLRGDFSGFRAPNVIIETPLDEELLTAITRAAAEEDYKINGIRGFELDHGTLVPLYFLLRNGWRGSVVALGYNFLSNEHHLRFGACITRTINALQRPTAFVASGDLSHRLTRDAPAGYFRDAHLFDEEIVNSIKACEPSRVVHIDQDLRRAAGECGYRSMLILFGAVQGEEALNCEVLHYEAPFGVGYLVAQIMASDNANKALMEKGTSD
ncbi:MAG: AmmeMemoRadiSam system protein B [Pyrinomonadaceae bacterium]